MRWSVFIALAFAIALGVSFQACSKAERRYFAESCASNSECESNLCIAGVCSKSCVSDAACGGGVCLKSVCQPITAIPCTSAASCLARIAGGPCRSVSCKAGSCALDSLTDGASCQIDACQSAGTCQKGACTLPVAASGCDDGFACTIDYCNAPTGCVHAPNQLLCNDQIACTTDICSADKGCQNIGDASACSDADPCTKDTCYADGCHHPPKCDDGNSCTFDTCSASGACANGGPIGMACEDGNLCTYPDACITGSCQSGPPVTCDDANPCTADSCVAASGCLHAPLTGPVCKGVCGAGSCEAGICLGTSTTFDVGETGAKATSGSVRQLLLAGQQLVAAGDSGGLKASLWALDTSGTKLWSSDLGMSGFSYVTTATPLGSGFAAAGVVLGAKPPLAPFVAAVDGGGKHLWSHVSSVTNGELAAAIEVAGGVVAAGSIEGSPTKLWLIHLSAAGKELSSVTFSQGGMAKARGVAVAGSGIVVVGSTDSDGAPEMGLVQRWDLDAAAPKQSVILGSAMSRRILAIAPMGSGWLAMGSEGVNADRLWLVRLDGGLQVQWQSLGTPGRVPAQFALDNAGLWIVGKRDVTDAGATAWLARHDLWGNQVFERSYPKWNELGGLALLADSSLAVGGVRAASASAKPAFVARLTPWGRTDCANSGPCAGLSAADCDDGVACTADDCSPASGCTHAPLAVGAICDEAGPCKLKHCGPIGCIGGPFFECADSDPCTLDSCGAAGCVHTVVADGTPCLGSAVCMAGLCGY